MSSGHNQYTEGSKSGIKVEDYLTEHGLTGTALANMLGLQPESVNGRRRRGSDMPEHWLRRLGHQGDGAEATDGDGPPEDDGLRHADAPPMAPADAIVFKPAEVDYATLAGHIEGAYKLAATYAVTDPILAASLNEHAEKAGQAWAHYIESEPRVAALVQRLMIGTPLGEVIGVHVSIVFAYVLARTAAREIAAQHRAAEAEAAPGDGSPGQPAEDFLADAA